MAPVAKRFTISLAGSTSSIGTGSSAYLNSQQAAQRAQVACSARQSGRCIPGRSSELFCRTACCSLLMVAGFSRWCSPPLAVLILPAHHQLRLRLGERLEGVRVLHLRFARQHIQPNALDPRGGPVRSRRPPGILFNPTASNICAPR